MPSSFDGRWFSLRAALSATSIVVATSLSGIAVVSCGAEQASPTVPKATAIDLDGDVLALVPPGAIAVLSLDLHALNASPTLGPAIRALSDSALVFGANRGFVASRDLDQAVVASYAIQGPDMVVVLRGHFDKKAIESAAIKPGSTSAGEPLGPVRDGLVVTAPYSGYATYSIANVGFAVLTEKTALAGTGAGLRLALDRIRDGRVKPELPSMILDALRTKGAVASFASDVSGASLTSIPGLPIPSWVGSIKGIRATATLEDPNVKVSGVMNFDAPERASAGADALRQLSSLVNTMAMAGVVPKLDDIVIVANGGNIELSFSLEGGATRSLLQHLPEWLPRGKARVSE